MNLVSYAQRKTILRVFLIALLAKANAAITAQSLGQIKTTINVLNAFINQVSALAGRHIADAAASHMIMHAQAVI